MQPIGEWTASHAAQPEDPDSRTIVTEYSAFALTVDEHDQEQP